MGNTADKVLAIEHFSIMRQCRKPAYCLLQRLFYSDKSNPHHPEILFVVRQSQVGCLPL